MASWRGTPITLLAMTLVALPTAPAGAAPGPGPGPIASGHLAVKGPMADGATIGTAGVTWAAAPCAHGVCSAALTISYAWSSCRGSTCGPTAMAWDQPFLPNLLLGPGDVGRTVKVTETATDVRTDGSTRKAAVVASGQGTVKAWPAGQAPRLDFIHGLPEASTASTQEKFSLSPPHANPADGDVTVTCSLDGGAFRAGCTGPRGYTTSTLRLGPHSFAAKVVNRAGSTTATFTWAVTALPAPAACPSCFHPPHLDATGIPMTWDWQLSDSGRQLVYRNVDMLDIDGFENSASDVGAVHARPGRTLPHEVAICYLSLGSWENFRPDADAWPAAAIGLPLAGYPDEHWVDVRQLSALRPVIQRRLQQCATKGFDGVEVDNIDGWDNASGLPLTQADAEAWLAAIANQAHDDLSSSCGRTIRSRPASGCGTSTER